jgi:hypothetical protein
MSRMTGWLYQRQTTAVLFLDDNKLFRWATDAIEERLDAGAAGGEGEEVAALDQLRLRLMT